MKHNQRIQHLLLAYIYIFLITCLVIIGGRVYALDEPEFGKPWNPKERQLSLLTGTTVEVGSDGTLNIKEEGILAKDEDGNIWVTKKTGNELNSKITFYLKSRANESQGNICIKAIEFGARGEINKARIKFDQITDSSFNCDYDGLELLNDISDGKVSKKAATHIFKAWLHDSKHEYKEMATEGSKAILLDPNYSHGYNVRGAAYGLLGESDKAINDIDRSLALNPNDPVSYNARGLAYKAKGDIQYAEADFNRAIELGYTESYIGLTGIYMMKGEFKQGLKVANRSVELNPNMAESWSSRAFFNGALGNKSQAKKDIAKALSIEPKNPDALLCNLIIYDMAGEKSAAIVAMHEFLEVASQFPMMSAQTNYVRKRLNELEAD